MRPRSALVALAVAAAALAGPGASAVAAPETALAGGPAPVPEDAPAAALPAVIATIPTTGYPSRLELDTLRKRGYALAQDQSWGGSTYTTRSLVSVSDLAADRPAGAIQLGAYTYSWTSSGTTYAYTGSGTTASDLAFDPSTAQLYAAAQTSTARYTSTSPSGSYSVQGTVRLLVASEAGGVLRAADLDSSRSDQSWTFTATHYTGRVDARTSWPIGVLLDPRAGDVVVPLMRTEQRSSYDYDYARSAYSYSVTITYSLALARVSRSGSNVRVSAVDGARWTTAYTYPGTSSYAYGYPVGISMDGSDVHVAMWTYSSSAGTYRSALEDIAVSPGGRALITTAVEAIRRPGATSFTWISPQRGAADPSGGGLYVPLQRYTYDASSRGPVYDGLVVRMGGGTVRVIPLGTGAVPRAVGFDGTGGAYAGYLQLAASGRTWSLVVAPIAGATGGPITVGDRLDVQGGLIGNAAARRLYLSDAALGNVTVIDLATSQKVTTVPVGRNPLSIATDRAIGRVYTANNASQTLSVIDDAAAIPGEVKRDLTVDVRSR